MFRLLIQLMLQQLFLIIQDLPLIQSSYHFCLILRSMQHLLKLRFQQPSLKLANLYQFLVILALIDMRFCRTHILIKYVRRLLLELDYQVESPHVVLLLNQRYLHFHNVRYALYYRIIYIQTLLTLKKKKNSVNSQSTLYTLPFI